MAGLPICAVAGAALGVLGSDPLASDPGSRLRLQTLVSFGLFGGFFVLGLYAGSFWLQAQVLVLSTTLSLSLWQKARRHLPYILDPVAEPPRSLTVTDGLLTALLFFVLQIAFFGLALGALGWPPVPAQMGGFALSSVVVVPVAIISLRQAKVPKVEESVGLVRGVAFKRTLAVVLLGSIAAIGMCEGYLFLVRHWHWSAEMLQSSPQLLRLGHSEFQWLILAFVGAAPLCEEVVFRGMIFRSLCMTYGFGLSAWASAGIFAVVHPVGSAVPVFFLGLFCAMALERSKTLIAPMAIHALYNVAVVMIAALR